MIHHRSIGHGGKVDVWSWMQQKQALEVQLAWELVDVFSSDVMLKPLNMKCLEGIEDMYSFQVGDKDKLHVVQEALKKENNLALVKKYFPFCSDERQCENAFIRIINAAKSRKLDLNECCEFIRLYGEFGEQAKNAHKKKYVSANKYAIRDKARQNYKKYGRDGKDGGDEGPIWGKKTEVDYKYNPNKIKRAQIGGRLRDHLHDFKTNKIKPENKMRLMEFGPVREFLRKMGGGMDVWIEKEGSTLQKVNMMFGLTSGADISGTTTDTAWYIDQFVLGKISPIFYLLPLSYIVAVGHHTTLEVGAALSVTERAQSQYLRPLNIHYSIGSYQTLLPGLLGDIPQKGSIASNIQPVSAGARDVKNKLKKAQNDPRNKRILIYYDDQSVSPTGCIEFEDKDINLFKKIATVSPQFLSWFKTMSFVRPHFADVASFVSYFGGKSIQGLPTEKAGMRSGVLYAKIVHTTRRNKPGVGDSVDVVPYDASLIQGGGPRDKMLRSKSGKRQFIPLTIDEERQFDKGQFKPQKDIIKVSGKYWIET
jgi:hypothetical protein